MSGVVLRCPNCGTVQTRPGECEACHEEQVRYFCTNHAPGLWLNASSCGQCHAQFGEVAAAPPAIERPASVRSDLIYPDAEPYAEPRIAQTARDHPADREDEGEPYRTVRNPWLDVLVTASRLRKPIDTPPDDMESPLPAAALGGCLKGALMLVLFLGSLFVLFSLLVGGFLVQFL